MYLDFCAELMRELATALTLQMGVESVDQLYDASCYGLQCDAQPLGSRWAPEEVLFSRARPDDVGAYRRYFRALRI